MKSHNTLCTNHSVSAAVLFLIAAAALFSASRSASAPYADKNDYWPMELGNTWTGVATVGKDTKMTQEITVTSVKKEGNARIATMDYRSDNKSVNVEIYRITPTLIERLSGGPNSQMKLTPSLPIIRYPLTAGKSWKWDGSISVNGQDIKATSTFTVSGPETVKVTSGTFKAMHVHSELVVENAGAKTKMPNDYWFAPGVGMVKQFADINGMKVEVDITKYKLK